MGPQKLVDFPYVLVRIRCDFCQRSGAYKLARLAAKFGSEAKLDDVLERISKDCAVRHERRGKGCGARFVDLPMVRPPDAPVKRMMVIRGGKT